MAIEQIIPAVSVDLIEAELTAERLLRPTRKAGNLIYVVDAFSAPNTMREIGRLREIAFRAAGGGTGTACDIDEYDTMQPHPCRQLIVWDPQERIIIGGYRYVLGENVEVTDGVPRIATSHMFRFSEEFLRNYLPQTIELGRSWVRPELQSSRAGAKAIFALDNLWDGLGALMVMYPHVKYFFGKVTMYPEYPRECRDALLCYLNAHFSDPDELVRPIVPLPTEMHKYEHIVAQSDYKSDFRALHDFVRARNCNIPPLMNAYISLSPTMRMLGTAVNDLFGNVEESAILISVDDISDDKRRRHTAGIAI